MAMARTPNPEALAQRVEGSLDKVKQRVSTLRNVDSRLLVPSIVTSAARPYRSKHPDWRVVFRRTEICERQADDERNSRH
jgi:hypothetical protein